MRSKKGQYFGSSLLLPLMACSHFFACSSGELRSLPGSSITRDNKAANASNADAAAPATSGDLGGAQSAEPEMASPPQVITGAYLVCAEIQPLTDSDPTAVDIAARANSETVGFACGVQNEAGAKSSATVEITESKILYTDQTTEISEFSKSADASRWNIYFMVAKLKSKKIRVINLTGTVDGVAFSTETPLLPETADPGLTDFHLVFVTSAVYTPGTANSFVGLSGADFACAQAAKGADLRAESWRAVLATSLSTLNTRFTVSKLVKSPAGAIVFDPGAVGAKFPVGLSQSLNVTEFGTPVPISSIASNQGVWTGPGTTVEDSSKEAASCVNWTSNKNSEKGLAEGLGLTDKESVLDSPCNEAKHLYCLSQFQADRKIFYRDILSKGKVLPGR